MESIKKLEDQLMVKQKKLGGEKVINEEVAASASSVIANGEVSCYIHQLFFLFHMEYKSSICYFPLTSLDSIDCAKT